MSDERREICRAAASAIRAGADDLNRQRALIGFDGFVDEIIAVVEHRHDAHHYDRVPTIARMAEKIAAAAGRSSNYELMVTRRKLGGNGPIMANALANLGLAVEYVGSLGLPTIDPVFDELGRRASVVSVANPGFTNALEFDDGKLMLSKLESLHDVTWEALTAAIPVAEWVRRFGAARLIGLLNWTELPGLTSIWDALIREVLPHVPRGDRVLFVDLVDPEKRLRADLQGALATLTRMQGFLSVTLGLNLKEAAQVAEALDLPAPGSDLIATAQAIRAALGLACVVIHPREGAVAATEGESARLLGPFVTRPLISTGAGDHFNAGFGLGQVLGLSLVGCLAAGVATSGHYVRTASSPTAAELADFLDDLPPPEA